MCRPIASALAVIKGAHAAVETVGMQSVRLEGEAASQHVDRLRFDDFN